MDDNNEISRAVYDGIVESMVRVSENGEEVEYVQLSESTMEELRDDDAMVSIQNPGDIQPDEEAVGIGDTSIDIVGSDRGEDVVVSNQNNVYEIGGSS